MSSHRALRFVLLLTPLLLVPLVTFASIDANSTGLVEAGRAAGLGSICSSDAAGCIATLVGKFLNVILGFIGLILFGYMVYGGVLYMSAGGDDKQVKTAKDTLQNAIIGVFMILLAFGISSFVLEQAVQITGNDQAQSGGGGGGGESAGAPGSGSDSVSETGGSICRCPCAQSTLSLPVTACNATTCSAESCRSSCGILGGLDGTPSCGAAGAEAPLGGDLGLTCNCECNIGGRVSNVDPGTVAGVCNATPGGSCATACTNACRVAGGAPSSIGATCGAPRGDTRVPSARCETTVGIGIAPYNATIRTGGLCTYAQRQCDACMREQLVNACATALRASGIAWNSTQIAVAQGNANAVCGATCNPGPESYAVLCP